MASPALSVSQENGTSPILVDLMQRSSCRATCDEPAPTGPTTAKNNSCAALLLMTARLSVAEFGVCDCGTFSATLMFKSPARGGSCQAAPPRSIVFWLQEALFHR